jgi:hypothetical protein
MEGLFIVMGLIAADTVIIIFLVWFFCSEFATPIGFKVISKDGEWKIELSFRWWVVEYFTHRHVQSWDGDEDATFPTREKAEEFKLRMEQMYHRRSHPQERTI